MNEDIELASFIKDRLEGDVRKEPPHFEEIMRAESAQEEASVEEMLLAWRDAPYESAISGIVADN